MKKTATFILICTLVFSVLHLPVSGANLSLSYLDENGENNTFLTDCLEDEFGTQFYVNNEWDAANISATVTYAKCSGTLKVPETVTYDGTTYTVTAVDCSEPEGKSKLYSECTKMILPDTVTDVYLDAFGTKERPFTLVLGKNTENIYKYEFSRSTSKDDNCNLLEYITIDANENPYYKVIDDFLIKNGFEIWGYMGNKQECTIPSCAKEITYFLGAKSLKKINIPSTVNVIGERAFKGCENIETLTFSERNNTIRIFSGAFKDCDKVTKITVPAYLKGDGCFCEMEGLKEVDFQKGFKETTLCDGMFTACKNLKQISLPKCITEINQECFSECEVLKDFILPEKLQKIGAFAFQYCNSLKIMRLPDNLKYIGKNAFFNCNSLKTVTIPCGITELYGCTFAGCKNLSNVVFNNKKLKIIRPSAFAECSSLKKITLPNSVQRIYRFAFSNCGLTEFSAPRNLTIIGREAFAGTPLTTFKFKGNELLCIKERAFKNCKKLKNITLPGECKIICKSAFSGCKKLKSVTVKGNIKWVKYGTFSQCANLEKVKFSGKNLAHIYDNVFYKAKSLKSITISNTKNAPKFSKKTFKGTKSGIKFYVKNKKVATSLKKNLKKVGYKSGKVIIK